MGNLMSLLAAGPFLSTLPARGATLVRRGERDPRFHFYPRSPRGERRPVPIHWLYNSQYFYPRSPRGERPRAVYSRFRPFLHFYPRSPRGERPCRIQLVDQLMPISIHAPREGSDYRSSHWGPRSSMISIHAPREGSDTGTSSSLYVSVIFLSTLPARGATHVPRVQITSRWYFYPRSPRGERLLLLYVF